MLDYDTLPDTFFDYRRQISLDYLTEVDSRGIIGWEKLDPLVADIVHQIAKNPHTFHYGESCSGHLNRNRNLEQSISNGYISIGIDGSQESQALIEELADISESTNYFKMSELEISAQAAYQDAKLKIYHFKMGVEELETPDSKPLETHFEEYIRVWKLVEDVLRTHGNEFPDIWDRRETKQFSPEVVYGGRE